MPAQYMAVDQWGNTYHGLTKPRRDLIRKIGVQHCTRMYVDGTDGKTYHVGWVVGRHWCRVYRVEPMREVAWPAAPPRKE